MENYDDYFRTYRHIEANKPEAVRWVGIDSTGLAEVIELAIKNGYSFAFDFYDEPSKIDGVNYPIHRRAIIFTKKIN